MSNRKRVGEVSAEAKCEIERMPRGRAAVEKSARASLQSRKCDGVRLKREERKLTIEKCDHAGMRTKKNIYIT